ncbi:unnamed protein product [Bursaphelenchus xylophilus]|uniref:10 kDa heat shock protein, mitochondrial n=1 Tax=Bursaphelenchus xylophilus TaxID=6326 RepID=A0A1I7SSN6_BURXY|nr:unnamed protein product [Bursaphelenchus xylophilus]CAG9097366.1 unnamed protein product [Bursaphelenchus xylophilus]
MVFFSLLRHSEALRGLRPLYDRVLVERAAPKSKTPGGIMLPESETDKFHEGVVVAVGEGARTESGNVVPNQLKVKDRVILPLHGGQKIKVDNREICVYKEAEIVGVFE